MLLDTKELLKQKHMDGCPFIERIAKLQQKIEQEKKFVRQQYLRTLTIDHIEKKCDLSFWWAHAVVKTIHGNITQSDLERLVDGAAADRKIEKMKRPLTFDEEETPFADLIAEGLAADIVWDDALEVVKEEIQKIIKGL